MTQESDSDAVSSLGWELAYVLLCPIGVRCPVCGIVESRHSASFVQAKHWCILFHQVSFSSKGCSTSTTSTCLAIAAPRSGVTVLDRLQRGPSFSADRSYRRQEEGDALHCIKVGDSITAKQESVFRNLSETNTLNGSVEQMKACLSAATSCC